MVDNPNYSVPFTLSYQPLDTNCEEPLTPSPLALHSAVPQARASCIDMVDNECYSVPSISQSLDPTSDEMERAMTASHRSRRDA